MRILSLKQHSSDRISVRLDDGSEIASTLATVTELRLFTGRELDEALLERLRTESRLALAREKALELISRRQMSRRELAGKLREKGFDEETAAACVKWISERGLIDEQAYAAAVVRHYAGKGYGEGRLRAELQRRGIPRELRDRLLEEAPQDTSKLDRFIAARLKDPDDRDELRKLSAALYRRGFSGEEIRSALARFSAACEYEE